MEEGSHPPMGRDPRQPRRRTAYDKRALKGEVPFVVDGNPTPEERRYQERADKLAAEMDAQAATVGMVKGPNGELLSAILTGRGNAGWSMDRDRLNVARITAALLAVETAVDTYKDMAGTASTSARLMAADEIVAAWLDYRDIVSMGGAE